MTNEWHGWKYGGPTSLHIGPVPERKGIGLYMTREGCSEVLAYFKSAEKAHAALLFIDALCETLMGEEL